MPLAAPAKVWGVERGVALKLDDWCMGGTTVVVRLLMDVLVVVESSFNCWVNVECEMGRASGPRRGFLPCALLAAYGGEGHGAGGAARFWGAQGRECRPLLLVSASKQWALSAGAS